MLGPMPNSRSPYLARVFEGCFRKPQTCHTINASTAAARRPTRLRRPSFPHVPSAASRGQVAADAVR